MSVSSPLTPRIPRSGSRRAVQPVTGSHARLVAESQGCVWGATSNATTITEHVLTAEQIDGRGDSLLARHRRGLARALSQARQERAVATSELLCELIGTAALLAELDDAEDYHRRRTGEQAVAARRSLLVSNAIHAALLGQSEAGAEVLP